jgi:hypothetical protein
MTLNVVKQKHVCVLFSPCLPYLFIMSLNLMEIAKLNYVWK